MEAKKAKEEDEARAKAAKSGDTVDVDANTDAEAGKLGILALEPEDWTDNPLHGSVAPPSPSRDTIPSRSARAETKEATDADEGKEGEAESQPLLQRMQAIESENLGLMEMVRQQASKVEAMQREMKRLGERERDKVQVAEDTEKEIPL